MTDFILSSASLVQEKEGQIVFLALAVDSDEWWSEEDGQNEFYTVSHSEESSSIPDQG